MMVGPGLSWVQIGLGLRPCYNKARVGLVGHGGARAKDFGVFFNNNFYLVFCV